MLVLALLSFRNLGSQMINKLKFDTLISWGYKSVTSNNFLWRLALWSAALILILYLIFSKSYFEAYGAFLISNYEVVADPGNTENAMEMLGQMGSMFLVLVPMQILFWMIIASAETAYHKNAFFGQDKGFFPLRFGVSELKLMLTHFLVFLSFMAVYLLSILGIIVLAFIGAALSAVSEILGAIVMVIGLLAGLGFMIFALLYTIGRLTPAGALTIKRNKAGIRDAWKLSKGNVSPIFLSLLLIIIIGYVVMMVIQYGTLMAAFGSDSDIFSVLMGTSSVNPEVVFAEMGSKMENMSTLIVVIVGAIALALFLPLWYLAMWGVGNRAAAVFDEDTFG